MAESRKRLIGFWIGVVTLTFPRWMPAQAEEGESLIVAIRSAANDQCLLVEGASLKDGGRIFSKACQYPPHQKWWLRYVGAGYYTVTAVHSGKRLDATSGLDGAVVHQWTAHNGLNQQWRFERRPSGAYHVTMRFNSMCLTYGEPTGVPTIFATGCREIPEQDWFVEILP